MLVETLAFALIGLIVGAAALVSLPAYFPGGRALTAGTALVAALLGGVIMHFTLDGAFPGSASPSRRSSRACSPRSWPGRTWRPGGCPHTGTTRTGSAASVTRTGPAARTGATGTPDRSPRRPTPDRHGPAPPAAVRRRGPGRPSAWCAPR
ncbi:hypothetical protein ACFQ0M_29610 [Kitasatospora aburaviensis]